MPDNQTRDIIREIDPKNPQSVYVQQRNTAMMLYGANAVLGVATVVLAATLGARIFAAAAVAEF